MSELTLYRKYRPTRFADVVGQDQVVSVLEGAITRGTITHAYLFSGSRGTGKTSVARIFARAIDTAAHDLYEIDAASSRGIDEIRELREGVRSLPFSSRYKVYIIDEVHMLTKEAFNALLKTLEEPPAHAIFILATTDPHKLPETIISRCQTFTFRRPTVELLEKNLLHVARGEKIALDEGAAHLLALLGEGSFRDSLGFFQKIIAAAPAGSRITLPLVEKIAGTPSQKAVNDFIRSLLAADANAALAVIAALLTDGQDIKFFLNLVLVSLRHLMLIQYAPDLSPAIKEEVGESVFQELTSLYQATSAPNLPAILKELLSAQEEIGRAHFPHLSLELAVVRIITRSQE